MVVMPRANRDIPIEIRRGADTITVNATPVSRTRFETGDLGIVPELFPQVRAVSPGQPADRAGIKTGDVIVAVNGEAVTSDRPVVKTINESAGKPLTLTVRRGETKEDLTVTPEKKGEVGLIGVQLSPYEVRVIEPGPLQAVQMSLQRNWEWTRLIFQTLAGLFKGETSPKQLMGPVGIAQLSGGAAQAGWVALFSLMAMISLNLGLVNLLPIPVLDGGHIFILAVEGVTRRDFSVRVKEKMLLAGFVVLMMLMVTVIYNDLTRIEWIEKLMPWR